MSTLYQHYKDKNPLDTINIINDFFNNKNCTIVRLQEWIGDSKTYSCIYGLLFKNKIILTANGKGMSAIYAQASAYGEMYERFCLIPIHFWNNVFSQKQYNHFNQFPIQYDNDEYICEYFRIKKIPLNITNEQIKQIFFPHGIYGVEYKTLDNTQTKIFNPIVVNYMIGTNGCAAGNNIEEALVQASSEFFERYAIHLFWNKIQNTYYYIDPECLSRDVQKLLFNIKEKINCKIYIYDLSYNFNIPVCMLMIYDISNHMYYLHFGSHPIIDIAVERCITEIYQGFNSLDYRKIIIPYDENLNQETAFKTYEKTYHILNEFPIQLLSKQQYVDKFNEKVFLQIYEINNIQLLNHIIFLSRQNNINLFYKDFSLTNNMYTVQVISEKIVNLEFITLRNRNYNNINLIKNDFNNIINFIENPFENLSVLKNIEILKYLDFDIFNPIYGKRPDNAGQSILFNKILNNKFKDITLDEIQLDCFQLFQRFILSNVETDDILEFLNYKKVTLHDIEIYLKELYISETYQEFIKLFK